jgi:DNA-binding NarL/FixJ family response regulator
MEKGFPSDFDILNGVKMIPISIWIVEDDTAFRRTLQRMLDREEQMICSRVFPSCEKLFEILGSEDPPDLLLMDLGLPGMGGVEGIQKLKCIAPDISVVVLTVFQEKEKVLQALDAGAVGYLLKTSMPEEIIRGLEQVFYGGSVLSPSVAKIVLEEIQRPTPIDDFGLSPREIDVLEQLSFGHPIKRIADELGISVKTVSNHLEKLYRKLGVQSQSGAVGKAIRAGII